ncbi:MAG TPA: RluA family pseudouridine synthase [Candidatus Bipolaricaulota bacterium]|nr:RluA family pseudouridine synthase [Candidatus Bipolaricaulota bacterium]
MKYKIDEQFHGWRLDKFLNKKLTESTRSQIKKRILAGLIEVNGKKATAHRFLKARDLVEIKKETASRPADVLKKPPKENQNAGILKKIKILDQKDDWLIIYKPANLLVHPTKTSAEKTLVDWLMKKHPSIAKVGEDPNRPGIVHRLDKETSGLMVIAKNQKMFEHLKSQFKKRLITKKYYALIYGRPDSLEDEMSFRVGRSAQSGAMAAHPFNSTLGKSALTEYEVIKTSPKYSLVDVSPKTGRTHQIRVHFLALNHPVVGDPLYKTKKYKPAKIVRMFLQAYYLSFEDLNGDKLEYKIALDGDLDDFFKKL